MAGTLEWYFVTRRYDEDRLRRRYATRDDTALPGGSGAPPMRIGGTGLPVWHALPEVSLAG